MNKIEVAKLFKEMDKFYFNRIRLTDEELMETVNSFYMVLQSYDTSLVLSNFYEHIKSSPHPPTVFDLTKEKVEEQVYFIPNAEETRKELMMLELPKQQVDPAYIKQKVEEGLKKIEEAAKNERKRDFNPFI